jgi:hypothetical protein
VKELRNILKKETKTIEVEHRLTPHDGKTTLKISGLKHSFIHSIGMCRT